MLKIPLIALLGVALYAQQPPPDLILHERKNHHRRRALHDRAGGGDPRRSHRGGGHESGDRPACGTEHAQDRPEGQGRHSRADRQPHASAARGGDLGERSSLRRRGFAQAGDRDAARASESGRRRANGSTTSAAGRINSSRTIPSRSRAKNWTRSRRIIRWRCRNRTIRSF